MRAGNLTDMKGYSLQRIKLINEIPEKFNNGEIYLYIGQHNTVDICVGDIFVVQQEKLIVINRSSLQDLSNKGSLIVNIE